MPSNSLTLNNPVTIDLHTHLRGTLTPATAKLLAEKNEISIPSSYFDAEKGYRYEGFEEFLSVYDKVGAVVRTKGDIEKLTIEHLVRSGSHGTRYIEFMVSPDHGNENGISTKDQFDAIANGLAKAKKVVDIEATVIATAVRHKGSEVALKLAEELYDLDHPIVSGFGLTGNERVGKIDEFAGAFYVAKLRGLGLTAHVGEWTDAKSILTAIEALSLDRIGHGVSAIEDTCILNEIVERQIGFEVCPSSNIYLGRFKSLAEHPIAQMIEAGCKVTIATDDPAYFHTSPAQEYIKIQDSFKLSDAQIRKISLNAIELAFCSNQIKNKLKAHLQKI